MSGKALPTGLPLFDQAQARRDVGMNRAEQNAGDDWRDTATAFVREYAANHSAIRGDDLWAAGLPEPPSKNRRALGPVLVSLAKAGVIKKDGFYSSAASNNSPKVKWKSLVYNE